MMTFANVLRVNVKKEFLELKRYFANTLSMILTMYFIFLGMFFGIQVVGDPADVATNTQYIIVNYVFWYLGMATLQSLGFTISQEAMRGTLEQLYMSPVSAWRILLARVSGMVFNHLFIIVFLLFASMLTTGEWLNLNPVAVVPILLLTVVSMIGVSFIVAGISVIVKQINAFLQILQFIIMAFAFIPLSVAPYLVFAPFVKGVDMTRQVMIHGYTLTDFTALDYIALVGNGIAYVAIGVVLYRTCEKIAMKKGLLGHY
ncbi:ABC transporter permease [Pontibacillus marinus]|nr:ABC transporter permease [Pontibacillus marinus]